MARDLYETTIALPDATGTLKALSGINVSLVPRAAQDVQNSLVDIFVSDTGMTLGPDPKSGATGTRVITTGASGSVRFWAEGPAEYDLIFEDPTITPPRISDRVGWNAMPAKPGTFPTSALKEDGGITQKMLSSAVTNQQVPIGGCIDWWRPAATPVIPPPPGFEVAMGQPVTQHEFQVAGSVILPNLQNVFILGATYGKTDGSGADANNLPAGGPGIRGPGGSNLPKNLYHSHGVPVPNHWHGADGGLTTGNHSHGVTVSGWSGNANRDAGVRAWGGSGEGLAFTAHAHGMTSAGGTDLAGNLGIYGNTGYNNVSLYAATNSVAWSADPGTDFRPYFYGLLRLIKVRRT